MKSLLVATDFSDNAKHAAEYAYNLANGLKANLVLCNALVVLAEIPDTGMVAMPAGEYDELAKDSSEELELLKGSLEKTARPDSFQPAIICISEAGTVGDVIDNATGKEDVGLIVMGTHGSGGLGTFLLGNHSRRMIDEANKPLLLIPKSASIKPIKKVAFATDFKHPDKDLKVLYELIPLLRPLNAELLITHIYNEKNHTPAFKKWIEQFLVDLSNKADYPNIYYRIVKSDKAERGLDWLCDHGQVDILAMVHREQNFIQKIITGSHTKKMADRINIPLLVLQDNS